MNTIRFENKDAFVTALESRRTFWRKVDEKQAKEHKTAEQTWLKEARKRMQAALKMDYDALKEHIGSRYARSLSLGDEAPDCPVLWEPKLDRVLAALSYSQGKTFTVDSAGVWAEAHTLLLHDPYSRKTVC